MLTRRWFSSCALCAATSLTATAVAAQQTAPQGLVRTMLQQTDGPAEGYTTLLMRIEIQPGFLVPRHTHPGIETTMVLSGGGILSMKGTADRLVKTGDTFQIPNRLPHALKNGDAAATLLVNYAVDKNQPLVTLAPE
jgi:quercetin dioxygenase-like cupin family protein